jgi:hypothetical protein
MGCTRLIAELFALPAILLILSVPATAQDAADEDWLELFNGRDLDGWIPKIRGFDAGTNYADTFRVEDGVLKVSYAEYGEFRDRFGHLFFESPYSHYRLRLEYRFVGAQAPGAPQWAIRNSGVMLHTQAPDTLHIGQDFPISIEIQFLGGHGDGASRATGNVCTPGTHIVYAGQFTDQHCVESVSPTFDGEQWVMSETLVLGAERIEQYINGDLVIQFGGLTTGGGVVTDYDVTLKPEGRPLSGGFIALQSEGHPVHFRNVELLNLKGCMDPDATNFRSYFVEPDLQGCVY